MSDSLPTPITRADYYLATLCGVYSGDLPAPITREDLFLLHLLIANDAIADGQIVRGRNLLPGTRDFSGNYSSTYITEDTYQGLTIAYCDWTDADADTSTWIDICKWTYVITPEPDTYYTLSFWAKGTGKIVSYFYPDNAASGQNDSGNTSKSADGYIVTTLNEDWTRHWVTWKTRSDVSGVKSVIPARLYGGNECYICGVKLEQGNTPTDWTPAPEDGELPAPITRVDRYLAYLCGAYSGTLPAPITRKDYYLAALCGTYDGDLPAPTTREDYYLAQLVADGGVSYEDEVAALDGTPETYKATMRLWFRAHGSDDATPAELTALCDKWYNITRPSWDGNVTFYQPDVSAVSTGTKGGDNADLTCTPSTDTVANQDDYAGLPLFACVDCNWKLDPDTLQPLITAIDGINDSFTRTDPETYVGVLQMSGYHYQYSDDTTYTHGYTATAGTPYADIEPVPEAVNPDGTFRQWVLHSKYMSHTTDAGAMSSYSGAIPTAFNSHNTVHTISAVNGDGYSGGTTADYSWIILMMYIKYGSLTLDGILQGCCNFSLQYVAQVAEEGVSRILLSTANAANLEVGMSVLLGNYSSSTDRGGLCGISGRAGCRITAIETVTIDDTDYSAVYVDLADTFDTGANGSATAGTTYLSSWHWATGSCDGVLGNDGSPTSCTSGKYPAKLQGIEYMSGGYEVLADVILSLYLANETYCHEPYICRLRANQSTAITSNYVATGLIIAQPETAAWGYVKKLQYAMGVFFPEEVGGSSSTYTRDAFYQNAATVATREWLAFGLLYHGVAACGPSCLYGPNALSSAAWYVLARLSPNGNRGELAA